LEFLIGILTTLNSVLLKCANSGRSLVAATEKTVGMVSRYGRALLCH